MKGIRTWLVCWTSIFLTAHFFTLFIPIVQYPGQAVVLGRLSLCFWAELFHSSCTPPLATSAGTL
jgi:hypothetical protein